MRLGQYCEVIRVHVPELKRRNTERGQPAKPTYTTVKVKSAPVCCLADIPIAHLSYHARRYGKIAFGFHREAAVTHGFNPVFYTLRTAQVLQSVYRALTELKYASARSLSQVERNIESEIEDLKCEYGHCVQLGRAQSDIDIGGELQEIEDAVTVAQKGLRCRK